MRKDGKFPNSRDFNSFFKNPQNKIRLQQFLKSEFENLIKDHENITFIYSVGTVGTYAVEKQSMSLHAVIWKQIQFCSTFIHSSDEKMYKI